MLFILAAVAVLWLATLTVVLAVCIGAARGDAALQAQQLRPAGERSDRFGRSEAIVLRASVRS